MHAFNFDRAAIIAAAPLSRLASRRSALASIAFLLSILILSTGIILPSAQAQTSSGMPGRLTKTSVPTPVPVDTSGTIGNDDETVPPPQAADTFVFVGSYRISNGPYWAAAPPCYTAREAAAQIFGGQPTDYAISVNSNTTDPTTITHTAFLDGFGSTQFFSTPQSEDFKSGTNYVGGTFSAYVHDHNIHGAGPTNFVWRKVGPVATPVVAGSVLISEFRLLGPLGTQDEFVELYNNAASQIVVAASDASAGWALRSSDGVTRFVVPNGVIIPSGGHYLAYGEPDYSSNRYSLSNYGGTGRAVGNVNFQTDIPASAGVALFSSTTTFNALTRLDSVGFSNVSDPLYFEGTALSPSGGITSNAEHSFIRRLPNGRPQDTGDNAADFMLVSTTGNAGAIQATLGAPGPESLSSPIERSSQFSAALLDPQQPSANSPNRSRNLTSDPANCSAFGTMTIRRTFTNNTGAPLTSLRVRIMNITGFPTTTQGTADIRPRTIADSNVTVTGGASVLVRGTTLETPPAQPACGGLNSTLSVPVVKLATPLANGASINLQFLLGVQQTGNFRFIVAVEALP